jgi:small-conductance mechanosensitive channel
VSLESDLLQPESVDDGIPAVVPEEQPAPAAPVDEDAALEAQTIALPDGDKLVPLSALSGARTALKEAKQELAKLAPSAERATQLEGQITQLQSQINTMAPVVQAYQAFVQQQQHAQQQAPPQSQPEDIAELESIARDFDFYKPDATLDLDKARRHMERVDRQAAKVAQRTIQPMEAQTTQERANYMLERAIATEVNGMKADPGVIRTVWARVSPDLASTPEGAKHLWAQALALTLLQKGGTAPAPAAPAAGRDASGKFVAGQPAIPPPLHTPRAGGSAVPQQTGLSAEEQRFLKQTGMSEKDYLESAANMPGGRR